MYRLQFLRVSPVDSPVHNHLLLRQRDLLVSPVANLVANQVANHLWFLQAILRVYRLQFLRVSPVDSPVHDLVANLVANHLWFLQVNLQMCQRQILQVSPVVFRMLYQLGHPQRNLRASQVGCLEENLVGNHPPLLPASHGVLPQQGLPALRLECQVGNHLFHRQECLQGYQAAAPVRNHLSCPQERRQR